ncbi:MAG: hypothetical protein EA359_17835 [Balneolaceae bacterium]|nr:MAG: hypothetical protein EA359_17835 [Balneolaceae bacterium]
MIYYKNKCCNKYSNVATISKVLNEEDGISVRVSCWRFPVNGFDDECGFGGLQKYYVMVLGLMDMETWYFCSG